MDPSEAATAKTFKRHASKDSSSTGSPIKKRMLVHHQDIKVLLPNGQYIHLREERDDELTVDEFIRKVRRRVPSSEAAKVRWGPHVFLEDSMGNRVQDGEIFSDGCISTSSRTLVLQDGQPNAVHALEDMWNVTPDPELLGALPQEYTLETALADILDNSLQAVWANAVNEKRLISLQLSKDKITIFDSGQGMDSTIKNSIAKWGTMGSSNHRNVRTSAIGGDPPFLKPYFGMYGFGGLVAAMHIGSVALVSSKTKSSKKVVSLTLEKEKLMERCKMEDRTWKTRGEFRDPTEEEIRKSPHGSFTKVELSKLKRKVWKEHQVMCMLKDIYFPYIQCDISDSSMKTTMPVQFEVNGINLTEVEGGEVAVTNMSSCIGLPFAVDLHLRRINHDSSCGSKADHVEEGNARITFFYYPIRQGKETLDLILEELEKQHIGINESFEGFCRVSIRRLGRLLPDARWRRLPFMEPKRKRGDKGNVPRVCFERVKAFIDTDAGFVPTTSKLDLSGGHAFTNVLKNLGARGVTIDGTTLEIIRDGRSVSASLLEKEYEDWVREMHDSFDEEVDCDIKEDVIVTSNMEDLGFCQGVFRVYSLIKRKGVIWKKHTRLKFPKSLPGQTKKNFYATLEYFLVEGLTEDRGNSKMICRPMEIPEEDGSTLTYEDDSPVFNIGRSKAFSIEFLSAEKCVVVSEQDWTRVADKRLLELASCIDILDKQALKILGLNGGLEHTVKAGSKPPREIFATVRSHNYVRHIQEGKQMNPIEQKNIVKRTMQMRLEVKCVECSNNLTESKQLERGFTMLATVKSINNVQGIYCFTMEGDQIERFYKKTGRYGFFFSLVDDESPDWTIKETVIVDVLPSDRIGRWAAHVCDASHLVKAKGVVSARIGSQIGPIQLFCYDEFDNLRELGEVGKIKCEIWSGDKILDVDLKTQGISEKSKHWLVIKAVQLVKGNLAGISRDHKAKLNLFISDEVCTSIDLYVLPGEMSSIELVESQGIDDCLQRGDIIHVFTFQVIDACRNHVEKGCKVVLDMVGLELQDNEGNTRKVDDRGCVRLGGLLKVTGPLNTIAKLSVYSEEMKPLYKREFSLLQRALCIPSEIPNECDGGHILEDIRILVVDKNGSVDRKMNGLIILDVSSRQTAYPLSHGSCCIPYIALPNKSGLWCGCIYHSSLHELQVQIKVNILCSLYLPLESCALEYNVCEAPLMLHDKSGTELEFNEIATEVIQNIAALQQDLKKCGVKVRKAEEELAKLDKNDDLVTTTISKLQGEIEFLESRLHKVDAGKAAVSGSVTELNEGGLPPEIVTKHILSMNTPAKFVLEAQCSCMFLSQESGNIHARDVLGVVSLLALVAKPSLAKAMADFVGMDNMLAIVCKTRQAANGIVRWNETDNTIERTCGLFRFVESRGERMHGKLRVYVLDEMRCYEGGYESNHPQKLLQIKQPTLKNGLCPSGFLGYAVNLVQLSEEHLDLKLTPDGNGLRGVLFYHLFKEMQVYDSRKNLVAAKEALACGGISLDGSVIHAEGCEEYHASRQETMVAFPVASKPWALPMSLNQIHEQIQMEEALLTKKTQLQNEITYRSQEIQKRIDFIRVKLARNKEKFREITLQINFERSRLEPVQKSSLDASS